MKQCLNCGKEYYDSAGKCPACGGSHWVLARETAVEAPGPARPEGIRWVGAVFLIAGLVAARVGLGLLVGELRSQRIVVPLFIVFLASGTLVALGIGLLRLTAWAYWCTVVVASVDVVRAVVQRFPGGQGAYFVFGLEVAVLVSMTPWFRTFLNPQDEVPGPRRRPLATLLGVGSMPAVRWARLGVFAGAYFAASLVGLLLTLSPGEIPAPIWLLSVLHAVVLTGALALMLRWLGGEILATFLAAVTVAILLLFTQWLLGSERDAAPRFLAVLGGRYLIDVLIPVGVLAMTLHAVRSEWMAVLAGSLGGGVAARVAAQLSGEPVLTHFGAAVASTLTFAAVLTAGTYLLRNADRAAGPELAGDAGPFATGPRPVG